MLGKQLTQAAAGSAAGEALYVDDVFSTYLYEGTGASQTITNGIDLDGEGGLVWVKGRHQVNPRLHDSERGANASGYFKALRTDGNNAEYDALTAGVNAFNSNGFGIGGVSTPINSSDEDYVSWTFRKAPGFFDVVTYTGNGTAGRTVAHSLGSQPGMIIVKKTNSTGNWSVYHRSLGATKYILLNLNDAEGTSSTQWNDTEPTSTEFTVGSSSLVNASGSSYVAYVFAHDDQSFGTNEDESIIKCGSYTGTGTAGNFVNLGFEPQFLIVKKSNGGSSSWFVCDSMRGMADATNGNNFLRAHSNVAEQNATSFVAQSTGFRIDSTGPESNNSGGIFIYIAIRRPHKSPSAGTDVFTPQATRAATDGTPSELGFTAGFPVDLLLYTVRAGGSNSHAVLDRMRGGTKLLVTASNAAEASSDHRFDSNEGIFSDSSWTATSNYGGLMFKRAPGFFDVVSYTGTGSVKTENHNLTVVPEMMIVKKRNSTGQWVTYHSSQGNTKYHPGFRTDPFYTSSSRWNNTSPTSTQFTIGTDSDVNGSTQTFVAYLFATLPGISKVGSYTGTGSSGLDVDCGFTSGARFVLIKRADSEVQGSAPDKTNWYLWDSARGIASGNDPWIALNDTSAEVTSTDYIDPLNAGFTVSTTGTGLNASGGTYLFLAIA